jgi:hypothetical protein
MTTLYVKAFGVTPARHRQQSASEQHGAAMMAGSPAAGAPGGDDESGGREWWRERDGARDLREPRSFLASAHDVC